MLAICDVTLRDGLQSLGKILTVENKLELYKMLLNLGVSRFEYTSFVSASIIPQLADAEILTSLLLEQQIINKFSTSLVLNKKGSDRALNCGSTFQTVVASASDAFSLRNSGQSLSQLDASIPLIAKSITEHGGAFRGSISMAFGDIGEKSSVEKVLHYIGLFHQLGAYEVSLADTTGNATINCLEYMLDEVERHFPAVVVNLHLHGRGDHIRDLVVTALNRGVRSFDLSLLGVGGCPNVDQHYGNLSYKILMEACDYCGINFPLEKSALQIVEQKFSQMTC